MPTLTVITGILLIALGVISYVGTGSEHPTALIPTWFGVVLAIVGLLAKAPSRRKLFMHIAVTVGLLGFLGTITGLIAVIKMAAGEILPATAATAAEAKAAMCFITGIFVAVCVNSFIKARRSVTKA